MTNRLVNFLSLVRLTFHLFHGTVRYGLSSRTDALVSTFGAGEVNAEVRSESPSKNDNSCILKTIFVINAYMNLNRLYERCMDRMIFNCRRKA